jgi:hypothetical protein
MPDAMRAADWNWVAWKPVAVDRVLRIAAC